MIGLIQRVGSASVRVDDKETGAIGHGLLALVGVQKGDTRKRADRLCERLLGYRVFEDESGRMNRSLGDTGGGLLLVPQFTLAANTRKGMRASFATAAPPEEGEALFAYLVDKARSCHSIVATGVFGAEMAVTLVNEGPVTFWLEA